MLSHRLSQARCNSGSDAAHRLAHCECFPPSHTTRARNHRCTRLGPERHIQRSRVSTYENAQYIQRSRVSTYIYIYIVQNAHMHEYIKPGIYVSTYGFGLVSTSPNNVDKVVSSLYVPRPFATERFVPAATQPHVLINQGCF